MLLATHSASHKTYVLAGRIIDLHQRGDVWEVTEIDPCGLVAFVLGRAATEEAALDLAQQSSAPT